MVISARVPEQHCGEKGSRTGVTLGLPTIMSIDHLSLISRCLGALIIVLYVILALFFVHDLLPDSSITIISNGYLER